MSSNLNFTEEGFSNIVIRNEKNIVQLRTNAFDDDEALRWKEVFTARNSTTYNAARLYHGVRYRFHEKFICLHGDNRHKGVKKTYTGCSVKMDIKIKLITKNTIRIDKDVRTHPCIITIEGTHNHPAEAASALQELRIPTATTDTFFKYFDLGMTVPQAIRFHQEKLNFNLSDLANAAVNPKSRSVYYMREKWLKTIMEH
ncbi:uncharacterized protein [Macrobrachium rosenbergii]|uniref:uncharacterized protein n=1 Tax=Macrobrachium rosenbergii TaxID=79674 RepID=UPI0034D56D62